jgi:ethanolamine ammonia-lyase large subunit
MALADIPLRQFLNEAVIPYEADEVTRLILDSHDAEAFRRRLQDFSGCCDGGPPCSRISHLTVGGFRDWLLSDAAVGEVLVVVASGPTASIPQALRARPMAM